MEASVRSQGDVHVAWFTADPKSFQPGAGFEMYRLTRRDETRRDEMRMGQRRGGERKRSARGGKAKRGRKNGRLRHDLADGRNETELPARIPPPVWKQLLCQPAPENCSVAWRTGQAAPSISSASGDPDVVGVLH